MLPRARAASVLPDQKMKSAVSRISPDINLAIVCFLHIFKEHENLNKYDESGYDTHSEIFAGLAVLTYVKHLSEDICVDEKRKDGKESPNKRDKTTEQYIDQRSKAGDRARDRDTEDTDILLVFVIKCHRDGKVLAERNPGKPREFISDCF